MVEGQPRSEIAPTPREKFERRRKNVVALLKLEKVLFMRESASRPDIVNRAIAELPEPLRQGAREAVNAYREQERAADQAEKELKRAALELYGDDLEYEVGKVLYRARLGHDPSGPVWAARRGGYFVVACPDPEDYRVMFDPSLRFSAGPAAEAKRKLLDRHGGTHHPYMRLLAPRAIAKPALREIGSSVLLIKGKPETKAFEEILSHERQHFINHKLLGVFARSERGARSELDKRAAFIKDELLSYLRDGSTGFTMMEHLMSETYAHLFDNLEPAQARQLSDTLDKTTEAIERAGDVLSGKQARAAMVMHLLDVPFDRMAEAIDVIARHYREELRRLSPLQFKLPFDYPHRVNFPPGFRTTAVKLEQFIGAFFDVSDRYRELVFTSTDEEMKEKLLRRVAEYKQAIEGAARELAPDGVLVPYGKASLLNEKMMEPEGGPWPVGVGPGIRSAFDRALLAMADVPTGRRDGFVEAALSRGMEAALMEFADVGEGIAKPFLKAGAEAVEIEPSGMDEQFRYVNLRVVARFGSLGDRIVECHIHIDGQRPAQARLAG